MEQEHIIQIAVESTYSSEYATSLFALTNLGRIFELYATTWHEIELPDFSQLDEGSH